MVSPVTDPSLLAKLNSAASQPVTDPELLRRLNGEDELTWGEVGTGVVSNFASNGAEYGGALVDMAANPIDSFMAITKFLGGGLQEVLPESLVQALGEDKEARDMFNGFVDNIKQDYGSMEGFKKALAERPVETMSDLSIVFNAAGLAKKLGTGAVKSSLKSAPAAVQGAASKASGAADKIIRAGEMLDPLTAAGRTAATAGKVAVGAAQIPSGVGTPAIREAFEAGVDGGQRGDDFRRGMRKPEATGSEAVNLAKAQVEQMRAQGSATYRQRMAEVGKSTETLNFNALDEAVDSALNRVTYKGKVTDKKAAKKLKQVRKAIAEWKSYGPEFHTAEGFDQLKQKVGSIREGAKYGTNARHTLDGVYNTLKREIVDQAPIYSDAMKGYSDAMELVKEFERTLSTGRNAASDTTLRKLQSVMRNGVATNYGARNQLAEQGAQFGRDWRPIVGGQAVSSWAPTGAARMGGLSGPGAVAAAGAATSNPLLMAAAIPGLAMSSPRVVGEAAHAAGRAVSLPARAGRGAVNAAKKVDSMIPSNVSLMDLMTDPILRNALYQALYAQGGTNEQ